MILYVNGDSNSAGCEAVHPAGFISDDSRYRLDLEHPFWKDEIAWSPYPDNLKASYGQKLADALGATLHCHARSAGSNDRIIRTTHQYLKEFKPDLIIIGWSTWEREEWYNEDDSIWYQVNGSGQDSVPTKWTERYKNFVINTFENPNWNNKILAEHEKIWNFHLYLNEINIPHYFFNCYLSFSNLLEEKLLEPYNWQNNYLDPYSTTYFDYLKSHGCQPNKSYHFKEDGHTKWAEFLLPHLTKLL